MTRRMNAKHRPRTSERWVKPRMNTNKCSMNSKYDRVRRHCWFDVSLGTSPSHQSNVQWTFQLRRKCASTTIDDHWNDHWPVQLGETADLQHRRNETIHRGRDKECSHCRSASEMLSSSPKHLDWNDWNPNTMSISRCFVVFTNAPVPMVVRNSRMKINFFSMRYTR